MKEKKKGFTLIELLAVIVILAIIALIAAPVIMNIISKANKSAFKDSAYGIIKAGELYYSEKLLDVDGMTSTKTFEFPDAEGLELKGSKPTSGKMKISMDGKIAIAISNGKYCIIKNYNDNDVTINEDIDNCIIPTPIEALEVNENDVTISYGEEKSINVDIFPTNATDRELNWISNDENVVTVDKNGKLKAIGGGSTTIVVSSKNNSEISKIINVTVVVVNPIITTNNSCLISKTSGTCENGTKLNIKVNNTENYNFYVIKDENNELTLIMDRNLGSRTAWITKDDYIAAGGTESDYGSGGNSSKGPLTAIKILEERTAGWTNIPSYNYTYTDDGGTNKYSNITRNNIRARLLTNTEATDLGCVYNRGYSCPTYLYENLSSSNTEVAPYGYWLSSANSSNSTNSLGVSHSGGVASNFARFDSYLGVRPVIKVSKTL